MDKTALQDIKSRILAGGAITPDEAYSLPEAPAEELYDAAAEITAALCTDTFDSCSIINARSGSCPENCKWCAQSAHWNTGCDTYPLVSADECMRLARHNAAKGVKRFSLVTSGRAVKGKALNAICSILRRIGTETTLTPCASLGLLDYDDLVKIKESGVTRYHCNLESAPSFFPSLCSTHTISDKLATIEAAHRAGLEICSGGIIGMGETMRQRVEFALTLRDINPVSIPINILCPIPGTPLADAEPLTEQEILTTIAIFRFVHPSVQLRFAGGRQKLSPDAQLKAMKIGINSGVVGDLLTTIGSTIDSDKELVAKAGYRF